ncbi:MAG: phage tail tape measure protein [Deferribacterales bacterium]
MVGNSMVLGSIFRLTDMISGPLKRINSNIKNTERAGDSLSMKMARVAKSMTLVSVAAVAIVGALWSVASSTIETQSRLGELASVGITDMTALESAATNFSNNFAGSTKADFLAAAYDIKSGISSLSDEGVAEFTALAGATAKATKSTVGEMTSLFATGYGIFRQQYSQLSDIEFGQVFSGGISASVKNFKTTGSEMAAAISSIGAAATNAQVPLKEQLSILGMLQATMSGSEAGTKYRAFISKAASAGKELGLRFMDANNQLLGMPEILTAIKSKYGETIDAVEKMEMTKAFGTEEAVALIDLLYNKVGDLQTNIVSLDTAMKGGKQFTLEMAQTMNNHLGASMQIAGQRFHNLLEIVGGIFAPMINTVVTAFSSVILWLQRAASALASSGFGRSLLNLVLIISGVVIALFAFSAAMASASFVMPMVTAALAPLGAMIGAITWPIWLAIGAVVALYIAYRKNFGGIADTISGWWKKISLVFKGVSAVFKSMKDGVGTVKGALAGEIKAAGLVGAVTTIAKILYRIKEFAAGFIEPFQSAFSEIGPMVSDAFAPLGVVLKAVGSVIGWVAEKLGIMTAGTDASGWRAFGRIVGTVMSMVVQVILLPIRIISLLVRAVRSLADAPAAVGRAFTTFGHVAVDGLMFIVRNNPIAILIRSIKAVIDFIRNIDLSASGAKMVTTLVTGIKQKIMAPVEAVKGGFTKLRQLLPFSDAKEGPLSQLTLSGSKIMSTLAVGVIAASPVLSGAVADGFGQIPGMNGEAQEVQVAAPVSVPAPKVQPQVKDNKLTQTGKKDGLTIIIQNLTLTDVSDPDDFIKKLQQLVEEHGGE